MLPVFYLISRKKKRAERDIRYYKIMKPEVRCSNEIIGRRSSARIRHVRQGFSRGKIVSGYKLFFSCS